ARRRLRARPVADPLAAERAVGGVAASAERDRVLADRGRGRGAVPAPPGAAPAQALQHGGAAGRLRRLAPPARHADDERLAPPVYRRVAAELRHPLPRGGRRRELLAGAALDAVEPARAVRELRLDPEAHQ